MRTSDDAEIDDPRRAFLLRPLTLGWLAGGIGWRTEALAGVFGELPAHLPEGRSIFSLSGEVWIDGQPATRDTHIGADAQIRTGRGATLVGVVGQDALILRGNSELQLAGRLLRIPTAQSYSSMNLSHAVAVCLAALPLPQELQPAASTAVLPAQGALEAALKDAEALLLEVGFLYPHTAQARMAKLRQLLLRAEPQEGEVALLRGMVRQLRWASRHGGAEQGQ